VIKIKAQRTKNKDLKPREAKGYLTLIFSNLIFFKKKKQKQQKLCSFVIEDNGHDNHRLSFRPNEWIWFFTFSECNEFKIIFMLFKMLFKLIIEVFFS